jgi:hypothetical protein
MLLAFCRLAAQRRDLLGVLARSHQIETEIGLEALLLKIERNERFPDEVGKRGAYCGVKQCSPNQISRDREVRAEDRERRLRRQRPQNDDE